MASKCTIILIIGLIASEEMAKVLWGIDHCVIDRLALQTEFHTT